MRVIHTGIQSEPAIGVLRQLEAETQSSEKLGLDWCSVLYTGKDVPGRVHERSTASSDNRFAFRLAYYRWLFKKSKDFDVILLRYSVYDPMQLAFVLLSRCKIYSVHHTLEVPELALSSSKSKTLLERVLGPITLSLVDGIVAVLPDILDYEMQRRLFKRKIPHKVYTNGVDYYQQVDFPTAEDRVQQEASNPAPELLFVASVFRPWQGLEDLFNAAKTFDGEFVCHVVGDLTAEQSQMLSADKRFFAHGLQQKEFISQLIARCDIGLSNLSAHKKDMHNVPALKVREYLMEGLAVYAGHGDMLPDDFAYYRHGPTDLHEITQFALKHRHNDRKEVSEISRPHIEKETLLKDLHWFLLKNQSA